MIAPGRLPVDRRGFALLVVIIVLLLVSLLASQLIMAVRTELRTAANGREFAGGRLLAEGGVNIALFRLLDNPEEDKEPPPEFGGPGFLLGQKYETVLPAGKIEYYAVDESGKINLNAGAVGLLSMFLEYHGLKPEEIAVVQDSLQDWRDSDNLTRLNGAEQEYYQNLVPPYSPRNGAIEDPGEFFLLKGTETLRGRFDPYEVFTVYNPANTGNRLNFDSLPMPIVEFLLQGDPDKIEQYKQIKADNVKITALQGQALLGEGRFALLRNYIGFGIIPGPLYSIVARGWAGGSSAATAADGDPVANKPGAMVRVLVKLNSGKDGFNYLSWREGKL